MKELTVTEYADMITRGEAPMIIKVIVGDLTIDERKELKAIFNALDEICEKTGKKKVTKVWKFISADGDWGSLTIYGEEIEFNINSFDPKQKYLGLKANDFTSREDLDL